MASLSLLGKFKKKCTPSRRPQAALNADRWASATATTTREIRKIKRAEAKIKKAEAKIKKAEAKIKKAAFLAAKEKASQRPQSSIKRGKKTLKYQKERNFEDRQSFLEQKLRLQKLNKLTLLREKKRRKRKGYSISPKFEESLAEVKSAVEKTELELVLHTQCKVVAGSKAELDRLQGTNTSIGNLISSSVDNITDEEVAGELAALQEELAAEAAAAAEAAEAAAAEAEAEAAAETTGPTLPSRLLTAEEEEEFASWGGRKTRRRRKRKTKRKRRRKTKRKNKRKTKRRRKRKRKRKTRKK